MSLSRGKEREREMRLRIYNTIEGRKRRMHMKEKEGKKRR